MPCTSRFISSSRPAVLALVSRNSVTSVHRHGFDRHCVDGLFDAVVQQAEIAGGEIGDDPIAALHRRAHRHPD
jgi:hypothetical protein